MTAEFTGERIIPGQVDADLWNEHFARYAFASRLVKGKRVLDVGCGTGYGSAELRSAAASVLGLDVAPEALEFARRFEDVSLVQASATALPFASASFDVVVCFEVIEHLRNWPELVSEARRLLSPDGAFIVSTPNKSFYAETRKDSGPNLFHEHEFEYSEFRDALGSAFPHVSMYLEDHVEGVGFRPAEAWDSDTHVRVESAGGAPEESSFFIAVCSFLPRSPMPPFVYMPAAANMLREKSTHIARLEHEVRTKDGWIAQLQGDHAELLRRHEELERELLKSNRWAGDLNTRLDAAGERIVQLQEELAAEHRSSAEMAAAYEAQLEERTRWALDTNARLEEQTAELARCVAALHDTEATLEERTRWAQSLNEERLKLEAQLASVRASRWMRLGRAAGLGPELRARS